MKLVLFGAVAFVLAAIVMMGQSGLWMAAGVLIGVFLSWIIDMMQDAPTPAPAPVVTPAPAPVVTPAPATSGHRQNAPATGGHRQNAPATSGHRQNAPATGGHRQNAPATGGHRQSFAVNFLEDEED